MGRSGQGCHKCESLTEKKGGRIRREDKGYRDITRGAIQTAIFLGNIGFFLMYFWKGFKLGKGLGLKFEGV